MNLHEKLIEARKTVTYLQKENKGEQYNYVSSSQVLGSIKAKLDELQVLLVPKVTGHKVSESVVEKLDGTGAVIKRTTTYFTELDMSMTWVNAEQPDEKIECPWYGQGVDIAGEKGVGKALTYAEKYFMLKFFNIPTDKDDPDAFQKRIEDDPEPPKQHQESNKGSGNGNSSSGTSGQATGQPSDLEKRATAIYFKCTGKKEGQMGWSQDTYKGFLKDAKEAGDISTDYGKKWTLQDIEWLENEIEGLAGLPF